MDQEIAVVSAGALLGFAGVFSLLVLTSQLMARRLRRQRIKRVLDVRWAQRRRNSTGPVQYSEWE